MILSPRVHVPQICSEAPAPIPDCEAPPGKTSTSKSAGGLSSGAAVGVALTVLGCLAAGGFLWRRRGRLGLSTSAASTRADANQGVDDGTILRFAGATTDVPTPVGPRAGYDGPLSQGGLTDSTLPPDPSYVDSWPRYLNQQIGESRSITALHEVAGEIKQVLARGVITSEDAQALRLAWSAKHAVLVVTTPTPSPHDQQLPTFDGPAGGEPEDGLLYDAQLDPTVFKMRTAFCNQCGVQLNGSTRFCPTCGGKVA